MTIDREELRRLCEAATPGPWKWWTSNSWRRLRSCRRDSHPSVAEPIVARDGHPDMIISDADQAFIAAARTAVPALLDALEAAEAEILDTTWQDHADHWAKRAVAAEAREKRLLEALKFYRCRDEAGHCPSFNLPSGKRGPCAEDRCGRTANAALAETAP